LLLAKGADVNAVDNNRNSALHYAAGYNAAEACTLLLENGADVSVKNADEKTAAEVAELNEHAGIVELLASFKGGAKEKKEAKVKKEEK
jgi:ankyrin repeat protein